MSSSFGRENREDDSRRPDRTGSQMVDRIRALLVVVALAAAVLAPAATAGATDDPADDETPSWVELLEGDLSWSGGAATESDESPSTLVDREEAPVSAGEPSGSGDVSAAATFVVQTTSDVVNAGDGVLSLREAMTLANSDAADSIIQLTPGEIYELTVCGADPAEEDANVNGDLDHTDTNALTIIGGSKISVSDLESAVITTDCQERILESTTNAVVTLNGLALQNADAVDTGAGGAVRSLGTVMVNDSIFTENQTSTYGGAIYAIDGITAHRSIFASNVANGTGGGALDSNGSVDVTNSLFFVNESSWAAAIYASGAATVTASTIFVNDSGSIGDVRGSGITSTTSFIGLSEGVAPACSTPVTNSGGYNFYTDTSCGTGVSTDTVDLGGDPDEYFGSIVSVLPGGPLHDVVPPAKCQATDLVSSPRPRGHGARSVRRSCRGSRCRPLPSRPTR